MKIRVFGLIMMLLSMVSCTKDEATSSNLSELLSFSVKELNGKFENLGMNHWHSKSNATDDLTNLTAIFAVSPKATVSVGTTPQSSGSTKNDFSNPLTYTVRAEDGSKTAYVVSMSKGAIITFYKIKELPSLVFSMAADSIYATVQNGIDLTDLTASFETTQNSILSINGVPQFSGVTKNNFQLPLNTVLKEEDGTEQHYRIIIRESQNMAPTAQAGKDQSLWIASGQSSGTATLNASLSSDLEGEIASYKWQEGGVMVASSMRANLKLAPGSHTFMLTVTDSKGLVSTDEVVVSVGVQSPYVPVDVDALPITKLLYSNLGTVALSDKFIFGQEFPLSFRLNSLRKDLATSDCKEVVGDHPGVYGIDPHYLLYKGAEERQIHINEAKLAYQNGSVVTFDFHQQSRFNHQIYLKDITDLQDKSLMSDIVNDKNGSRAWFYDELDQVAGIVNDDLGFPIVFRLWHEMDGGWFWWGNASTGSTPQLYIDFYRLTVNYLRSKSHLLLFAWGANSRVNLDYYPGDDYVDVVGFDSYGPSATALTESLIELSDFAANHNKVAVLAEIGYNEFVTKAPDFWSATVLKAIKDGGSQIRIAWVLAWFNAPWSTSQSNLYIPDINSSQSVKDKFIAFKNDTTTLFEQEVKALELYK